MASYAYACARSGRKSRMMMEFSLWFGLFTFFGFLFLTIRHPSRIGVLILQPGFMLITFILFFFLVFMPAKKNFRLQKFSTTSLQTSRKGFTYRDFRKEITLSWRDIAEAEVVLDANPWLGVYPRTFMLRHSRGRIFLENDPVQFPLEGAVQMLREIKDKIPNLRQIFAWFDGICPYCGERKKSGNVLCSCGEPVQFQQKFFRLQDMFKEEILLLAMVVVVIPGYAQLVFLAILIGAILLPYLTSRGKKIKTLNEILAEIDKPGSSESEKDANQNPPPN